MTMTAPDDPYDPAPWMSYCDYLIARVEESEAEITKLRTLLARLEAENARYKEALREIAKLARAFKASDRYHTKM
jgi:predicted nuclease with TOPRIM domain